jgi:hypothetical protein
MVIKIAGVGLAVAELTARPLLGFFCRVNFTASKTGRSF